MREKSSNFASQHIYYYREDPWKMPLRRNFKKVQLRIILEFYHVDYTTRYNYWLLLQQ